MLTALFIWASIQSLIVGITINLVKRLTTNYVLSAIFIAIALNILLQYFFGFTDVKYDYPRIIFYTDVLDFLTPGLLLLYVDCLMGKQLSKKKTWYFLPTIIVFLGLTIFSISKSNFTFFDYIRTPLHITVLIGLVIWKGYIIYRLYDLLRFPKIKLTQKQKTLLLWPRVLLLFLVFTLYIALLNLINLGVVVPLFEETYNETFRNLVRFNYVVFNGSIIVITIFFAFKYPRILSGGAILKSFDTSEIPDLAIYKKNLEHLIQNKKIHLDTELNEKGLAAELGIHSYILSRLLNDYMGKSFSAYINEKRIKEAKRLLENDEEKELTNFAVAVDSGFRSESVFYVNFKKITGLTPLQYKKKIMKD